VNSKVLNYQLKFLPQIPPVNLSVSLITKVYLHFYNPIGFGDWYAISGSKKRKDFEFYGIVFFIKPRLTYFTLSDLRKKKLPFGAKIRLNESFEPQTLCEIMDSKFS
jgi:hypothetical protein